MVLTTRRIRSSGVSIDPVILSRLDGVGCAGSATCVGSMMTRRVWGKASPPPFADCHTLPLPLDSQRRDWLGRGESIRSLLQRGDRGL
jgi:hypothetical protein